MKKLLLFLFCVTLSVSASAWGLLQDFANISQNVYKENLAYKKFLIYEIFQGRPELRACVHLNYWMDPDKPEEAEYVKKELFDNTQSAFSLIVSSVRQEIERSGRSVEFADFLAVWPKSFELKRVYPAKNKKCDPSSGQFDLELLGWKTRIPIDTGYSITYMHQGDVIPLQDPNTLTWPMRLSTDHISEARKEIALHEVLHMFGLADQYNQNSADKTYSLRSFEDLTKIDSAMQGVSSSVRRKFTCDDMEGVINAMDFVMRQEGKTSNRLQHGWADFCGRNYIYMDGVAQRNADPVQAKQEHDSFLKWASNGYKAADKPAFASKALDVQRDLAARLVGAQQSLSAVKYKKLELDGNIAKKEYEIANAKFYKWTPRQVQKEREKLEKMKKESAQLAQDIAQMEQNMAAGKFPEIAKKDMPVVAALPKAGNGGKGTASSKSAPVITGEYVGPKGAAVVPATPRTKTAPVAPQQPTTPVAKPKPSVPAAKPAPAQPVKVDNSPKVALDRYIAAHPDLRDSLLAVRTGTALPTQVREVQEYQALFDAYKKGETPNPMLASAGTTAPSAPQATPAKAAQPKKSGNEAKRKELEAKYKVQCTLYTFDLKYEKELTAIRKRLAKNKKLDQRQASLWKAYNQTLERVQNWPHCKELSAQIDAL